jgi:hypothetical protein
VARSPYQSVYRTEVERIETPSAIAGNAMRLSMPSDTYSGPSIQSAPPWYSSAWSTFWGRLKGGQPLITDPRGSSSFSTSRKTYHVPNYVHDDSFHWIVGNLYHRAIVGDVIGAAETPLRFAANPTRYTRAVGAGLYNAVVNVPRLPQIWEQTPDYQREDLAFRVIGLGLGSAYGAGSVAARGPRSLASPPVNPVPEIFARVVPGNLSPRSLGVTDRVFVTDAAMLRGLSPAQLAQKLEIPAHKSFQVIEFSSRGIDGIATPIRNLSPGFTGRGVTSGGFPEWTIPNGSLPPNSRMWRAQ